MGPYLAHVHVRNNRALTPGEQAERYKDSVSGQRYIDTVFDGGEVEFRPILAELNRMRYAGYLMIEYQERTILALPCSIMSLIYGG